MAAPHISQPSEIDREKAELRARMLAVRAGLDPALGAVLGAHVLRDLKLPAGAKIAGVWPLPGEIDLRPLWHALHDRGHPVLLPETPPRSGTLRFRHWRPGCVMVRERFGTERPDGAHDAPDIMFVPLLAFDRRGHRLGYGGGYYDRTLAAHPSVRAVGFGFAAQEVPAVPAGPHDRALPAIVTEGGRVALRGA
ncbi:MAG: 5-formyltetrahydrofolate cyclo-ligase [Rhodospirillales bacterium]